MATSQNHLAPDDTSNNTPAAYDGTIAIVFTSPETYEEDPLHYICFLHLPKLTAELTPLQNRQYGNEERYPTLVKETVKQFDQTKSIQHPEHLFTLSIYGLYWSSGRPAGIERPALLTESSLFAKIPPEQALALIDDIAKTLTQTHGGFYVPARVIDPVHLEDWNGNAVDYPVNTTEYLSLYSEFVKHQMNQSTPEAKQCPKTRPRI